MKDHQPGFVPFAENFGSDQRCEYVATTKERALQCRVYIERAEARGNVSQGAKTSGAQLAYIAGLPPEPKALTAADAAADLAGTPRPDNPSAEATAAQQAGVSAADKAAVLQPVADAEGWIAHDGGPCPVPRGADIEVRTRDGATYSRTPSGNDFTDPECFCWWRKDDRVSDIVAYRLKPTQPAAPVDPYQVFKDALRRGCKLRIKGGPGTWYMPAPNFDFGLPPSEYELQEPA